MDVVRVLIADDHPVFRNGLRALLASVPEMEVVGEATTGDEAVALAASAQPDVALMDLQMPGMGGIEATRRILDASPHIRVLVVTMFDDEDSVFAALRAGARGYMLKGASPRDMLRAIAAVGDGEAIFSPAIAQRLLDFFAASRAVAPPRPFPELTEREREILTLIVQGRANPQIATHLDVLNMSISCDCVKFRQRVSPAQSSDQWLPPVCRNRAAKSCRPLGRSG